MISSEQTRPLPSALRQQRLADDAFEHQRQLGPDLRLLAGRKDVDDAVDRLRRRVGVQRAERQVAGLGDLQRRFDRLEVAHLADQDDVRILAQRRAQRVAEAVGVAVHLALVDQAVLVLVDVLDRILDRQDVLVPLRVDLVEHRRQRRRLAAAGRAGDQHQPARPIGEVGQHRRQAELAEGADLFRDQPVDRADRAALVEDVAAEAGADRLDAEREVELHRLFEALLLRVGEHAVDELLGVGRRQLRHLQPRQVAVDADLRRRGGGDVQVGPVHLDHRLQQFRQCGHKPSALSLRP